MTSPILRLWLPAVLSVPLLLSGCGAFGDEKPETTTLSSEAQPAENESYPNLGTVPSERPTVTTQEQREALQKGLREQRQDALPAVETQPSGSSGGSSSGYSDSQPPAPPTPSTQSAPSQSSLTPTQRVAQAASQPQYTAPQNTSQYASQQQASTDSGVLMAGETPPDMLPPMAYNQGGYGGGTTVISSQGAAQPSGPAGGYGAGVQTGSQAVSAGYGDAYAGAGNLAGVIYFNHGSAGLSGNDRQVLRDIANAQKSRGGTLIVVGHASSRTQNLDPETHYEANLEMSQRRANAVAEALRGLGVSGSSLFVEGRGAVQPVYQEVMPTGEAGNRRVEIYLR